MPDALRAVIDPAPGGMVLVDSDDRIVELNPAAQRILGCIRDVIGAGFAALLGAAEGELEVVRAPLDGPGTARGVVYLRDMTRERSMEAALAHGAAVAATVRDATIETDPQFRVVSWNRAAEALYGWSAEEAMGRGVDELLRTEMSDEETAGALEDLASDGHVLMLATQRTRTGDTIEVEASVTALRDGAGYVAVNRDVTSRRRLEERLRETRHLEIVGRLAGGVAHDLNSQLTAIMGYAELSLADREVPGRVRPDLEQVLGAAERAGALTRQLLAFSRQQMLAPQSVEVECLVSDTLAARRRLVGADVQLIDLPMAGLDAVLVDPVRLEQVLLDIVANAGEAMLDGGTLTTEGAVVDQDGSLPTIPAGRYVKLAVTDTGQGMDAVTRSRAFEPFFTTKRGHTGLGLSTLYGFVGQSGGHVTLDSRPGDGTTVTLFLPPA
jgi:two-component system cell cycle sensor histidine kinase/response regulator CckA